ncbi:hypothetical protein TNCV_4282601 [Trichonephila clavipes]|nr:hypothetical protein TNCV_4282601 [Trichonephila clavipes]
MAGRSKGLKEQILDDSDSDCELENEEDDLDQSLNLNLEIEDEVVSEEQSKIVWDDPQLTHKVTILPFTGKNMIKGATVPCVTESDFFNCIFKNCSKKNYRRDKHICNLRFTICNTIKFAKT